jgi:hypothetical protein
MIMTNHIFLVIAFTFNIYFISGFRIHKTYPIIGQSKAGTDWGLGLSQGGFLPQDTEQLLLEEVFGRLHGRNSFSGMQSQEMKEMWGLSITNNLEVLKERLINEIVKKRSRQVSLS